MCRRCGSLALRALKIPELLVLQWEASIQVLTRVWELDSDCSSPIASSNGYPEGDTWSVVVMVVLAYCWVVASKSRASQCCITAYADNWGWFTVNPRMHRVLVDQTVLFVRATNMQIDWDKSWSWSTNRAHQQAIKGALQCHGRAGQVSQVNTAMNLGCQMTYRGPPKLGKFKKRLTTALNRLDRLAKLTRPLDEKVRLVVASVYACAFYGVQFIPLGISHFNKLRTQVADSLLGSSISRNSAIAIDCLSGLDDPMVVAIALALKSARRFLLWCSPIQKSHFLKIASRHSGIHNHCRGPAGCLKYFLLQLGWTISPLGHIHTQQQGTLDLCGIGLRALMLAIRQAWTHDLFLMSDRQCLHGLMPICQISTQQVLQQFDLTERRCLFSDIAGSFQTRSQQAKWDPAVTSKCPLCDSHDTRYHRIFECPAFAETRSRFQKCLDYFLEQGSLVYEIPVIHVNPALDFVRLLQAQHPEATIPDELYSKLTQLVEDLHRNGQTLSFYTDGSCQFPQSPVTRFASYSIILDTCLTNEDREHAAKIYQTTGVFPPSLVPLTAARTTGSQCIQRSELYAITRIIELFVAGQVYSDSASAIHHVNQCANATTLHQVQHLSDFDLVSRLFSCPNLSHHNLVKVKAHVDPHTVPHLLTAYQTLGNQLANDKAIQACWNHLPALVGEYWSLHLQYELEMEHLSQYYRFLLDLFQCRKRMEQQHPVDEGQQQLQTPQSRINFFEVLSKWTVQNAWNMTPCRVNLSLQRVFCFSLDGGYRSNGRQVVVKSHWWFLIAGRKQRHMVLNFLNRFGGFASFLDRPMTWPSPIYGQNYHVDWYVAHISLEDRHFPLGFTCDQSFHTRNVFVKSCSCTFNGSKGWHTKIYLTWSSINRHLQLHSYGWKFQVDGKKDRRDFTVLLWRCEKSARIHNSLCNFMPKWQMVTPKWCRPQFRLD